MGGAKAQGSGWAWPGSGSATCSEGVIKGHLGPFPGSSAPHLCPNEGGLGSSTQETRHTSHPSESELKIRALGSAAPEGWADSSCRVLGTRWFLGVLRKPAAVLWAALWWRNPGMGGCIPVPGWKLIFSEQELEPRCLVFTLPFKDLRWGFSPQPAEAPPLQRLACLPFWKTIK